MGTSKPLTVDRFISFLPFNEAITPSNNAVCLVDYWWIVHPDKGLVFYHRYSPMCNKDNLIVGKVTTRVAPAWAEVRFFPVVYIPARHQAPVGY